MPSRERPSLRRSLAPWCAALLLAGCVARARDDAGASRDGAAVDDAPVPPGPEAGALDAVSVLEASLPDAAALDTTAPDAAALDAGGPDASGPDAPAPDAAGPACEGPGLTRCGAQCVDLASAMNHCGACNSVCAPRANARAECVAGECDRACATGYGDCDGDAANGCETALDAPSHCGACGARCAAGQVCAGRACLALESAPPPRPLAPLAGARVGRAAALSWELPAGLAAAQVQLCRQRDCGDAPAPVDVTGTRYAPAAPLEPGVYFWRLRSREGARTSARWSATWQLRAVRTSGRSAAPRGFDADFDGDGLADIAVGAPSERRQAGGAYVYYGARAGLPSARPAWSGRGNGATVDQYGLSLAAGDVNGDGFVDLLVGEPYSAFYAGRVYVYLGRVGGLSATAAYIIAGGEARAGFATDLSVPGDLNGDGYADLVVGAPDAGSTMVPKRGRAFVFYGRPDAAPVLAQTLLDEDLPRRFFGQRVASLGDVNGDGFVDLLVSAPSFDNMPGIAAGFLGGPAGLTELASVRWDGTAEMLAAWGSGLAGVGDVNGDGLGDALVSSAAARGGAGLVRVFFGATAGLGAAPSREFTGASASERVGDHPAGGDDLDGDGFDDLAYGVAGGVLVRYGASATPLERSVRLEDPSGSTGALGGAAIAMPGDVDGDGYADLVVATPYRAASRGEVLLFRGGARGVGPRAVWASEGPEADGGFGTALAGN